MAAHVLRVSIVNYAHDPVVVDPERTLEAFAALREYASGLRDAGADVRVVQRYGRDAELVRDGILYAFVKDGVRGRPRLFEPSPAVLRRVAREQAHVVHVNGLVFPIQTSFLRQWLGRGPALFVQHHAERPWHGWRGVVQRRGLAAADAFLFTSAAQASPWRATGMIRTTQGVLEVMEGFTGLVPLPRAEARARHPLPGSPSFLWVGRLNPVKDPSTLLAGFELLLADVPTAHLTMVFGEADLLGEVEARLARSRHLGAAVTLVGRVPHQELAAYYGSADYVVAASHHEGSGFAVSEALACGAVPIVTDIPSFAVMTDAGRLGALWQPGDAADFARAALAVMARPHRALSDAAIAHHRDHLSTTAIGQRALAGYASVVARRSGASA